jgi:hypothetical protein
MPGSWIAMPTICSSRRTVALQSCASWADEGSSQCSQWADQGSNQCSQWADQGSNQCSQWADQGSNQCSNWADQGHNQCCDWWPCSWACDAFYWVANWVCQAWYWVANWVCQAWYWVANWVCQAWYWVANWVCQAWYWVANWVCQAWTWIYYVFCIGGNGGAAFLLTDGSILMNESASGYGTRRWWKLAPDSSGNYAGGTWIRVRDSLNGRKYFASAVMADGRLAVCGGEYSDSSGSNTQDETNLCEIYDPVADTWTPLPSPPLTQVGDAPCSILPDGRFLIGDINSTTTFTLDPAATAWTTTAAKESIPSEESWALVADGTVVTVEALNAPFAETYNISSNKWTRTVAPLSANIVETASSEIGPAILLTDGRVFFVGAAGGVTAIYTPGALPSPWSAGPAIPGVSRRGPAQGAKDGPAALEPGGKVLFPVAPVDGTKGNYLSPCTFFEFDGTNLATVGNPPNSNCPTYVGRLLVLPSGDIFWTREDDTAMYLFQSTDPPNNAWRPVITSSLSTVSPGATITVSGTQFNGLSQAVGYGDDYTAATNYPIVRIRNSKTGQIRYCRTANHRIGATPSMGVATGVATVSTQVTIPAGIEPGESQLFVVANGIPSNPVNVVVRRR